MYRVLLGFLLVAGICFLMSDPQVAVVQKGGNSGTISKVDAKTGSVTINMLVVAKKKKELTDKEYFLNDDAVVTIVDGGSKKTMTGKEAITGKVLKEGASVTFVPAGALNIKELTVGGPAKK